MYNKNLTEDLRLRLSTADMDFLRSLSDERMTSVSECIRSIIGEYRRSIETLNAIQAVMKMTPDQVGKMKGEVLSNGDTKTDKHDLV